MEVENLPVLSCTDVRCAWKDPLQATLQQYDATTVENHECHKKHYEAPDCVKLNPNQIKKIEEIIFEKTGVNALTIHR